MTETIITVLCLVAICVVTVGFIGYMIITNRIIKDQEQEIAELHRALAQSERELAFAKRERRK